MTLAELLHEHWGAAYAFALLASFWWPLCIAMALRGPKRVTYSHLPPPRPPEEKKP